MRYTRNAEASFPQWHLPMRIHILSDLHNEFSPYTPEVLEADVVVLAGDIDLRDRGVHWAKSAFDCPVLYVPGNHEFYGGHLGKTLQAMRDASDLKVRVLDFDEVVLEGVRFLGVTGWTDFTATGDPVASRRAAQMQMNDYKKIRTEQYRKIRPMDVEVIALKAKSWIKEKLSQPFSGKTVVITHHAPSLLSIGDPALGSSDLDAAYANCWDELFGQSVDLWIHGHTHDSVDYIAQGTRVVSNQRGYPKEPCGFDPCLVTTL